MNNRTSLQQLKWGLSLFVMFLRGIGRHFVRWRASYSFLAGVISTLFIICLILWYGILAFPLPWKETDPTQPGFEISNFKFTDYLSDDELYSAVIYLFPKGTNKSEVDKILISKGRAEIRKNTAPDPRLESPTDERYYYTYRGIRSLVLEFFVILPIIRTSS